MAAAVALLAASAAGVGFAATATIPDSDGVIHACRKATNGRLRAVAKATNCRTNERALSWSQRGPAGPQGPKGDVGPAGERGPVGPKGDPGAGLTSIDQLGGIACSVDGEAGTISLDWDAGNEAVLTCDTGDEDGGGGGSGGGGGGTGASILKVNEFSTGVTGAASDEFVEIANVGDRAADVGGFKLVYRSASGATDSTLATIPTGTSIPAGGFYLFGGGGYAGAHPADQSFVGVGGLAASGGGIGLRDASGALVDSVGYGDSTTNAFVEAHAAAAPPATAAPGSSAERLPDGHDTNDNAADFSVTSSPSPGEANH